MALLVKEFVDFEGNDIYADADPYNYAGAVGANCSLVASPVLYNTYTLKIIPHKTDAFFAGPFFTYTPNTTCITSVYIRFDATNFPPGNVIDVVKMLDENHNVYWRLRLSTGGVLQLFDTGGVELAVVAISGDISMLVQVLWQPGNASANWAWQVGATTDSGSGADFDTGGGATDIGMYLEGQGGDPIIDPVDTFIHGCYTLEGATDLNDRVGSQEGKAGDWQVLGAANGKITKDNIAPDTDEDGSAGSGEDLSSGMPAALWKYAGDDDPATEVVYSRAVAGSFSGGGLQVLGPRSVPSDVVIASKWIWRAKSTRGSLGFEAVYGRYNVNGDVYTATHEVADSLQSGAFRYWRKIIDARAAGTQYDPAYNERFVAGMLNNATTGKGTLYTTLGEQWCLTLHAMPTLSGKPSIGHFGNAWRGKVGRPL